MRDAKKMIDLKNHIPQEENSFSSIKSVTNETSSEIHEQHVKFERIFQDRLDVDQAARSGKKSPPIAAKDAPLAHRSLVGEAELVIGGAVATADSIAKHAVMSAVLKEDSSEHRSLVGEAVATDDSVAKHAVMSTVLERASSERRSLAGGVELILGGDAPTDDSIAKYAAIQGIDPEIMSLLMSTSEDKAGVHTSTLLDLTGKVASAEGNIKTGIGINASTLSALTQNQIIRPTNKTNTDQIQALKQQLSMSVGSSKVRLDAIYLGRDIEGLISGTEATTQAHQGVTQAATSRTDSLLSLGYLNSAETRVDLTNKSLAETVTGEDDSVLIRRQEQFLETSRRLTQALGERLTTQITKGAWSVEMELHPKSLGRIEIQLEMRNGELAAHFNPSQNVTRDLLQESFDRLKSILAEHGIDSAYIGLGSGKKQNFDGKPTDDEWAPKESEEDNIDELPISTIATSGKVSSDGLDVQV
tara:strand:+ start:6273 stop:7691 length:1419 start_codon:yes stop_codon:yes gene_type:complete